MTTRGIWNKHNALQTAQAWKDWQLLAKEALPVMGADEVAKYKPPEGAGWRTIDKKIVDLRAAIQEAYFSYVERELK